VRDLTWEYLPSSKPIQFVAKVFFRVLANTSFRFFSSIAVTNESEIEYFKQKNIKALLYSNGVTSQQFSDLAAITGKTSEEFTVSYVGKVGIAQNLEILVLVAAILKNVKFNIVGDGSEYAKLVDLVIVKKLKNVFIHGNVSWESVINFYQESDILYAQLRSSYSSAMPSKLYQYLNASRFIIYGGGDQAGKTLSIFENNIVIPPDNVNELVNAIETAKRLCGRNLHFESNVEIIKNNYVREENVKNVLQAWFEL
jgi:glycosyltransferase involved in cell wall biosynthesis